MGLQGSAHLTKDIDFCYARTAKNMERLAKALEPFHPVLRGAPPGLLFRFDAKTIANGLNFTLSTDLGDLDFLGEVSGLGLFQDVLGTSDVKDVGGVDCRVLSLEGLIKSKTAAGRPYSSRGLRGTCWEATRSSPVKAHSAGRRRRASSAERRTRSGLLFS